MALKLRILFMIATFNALSFVTVAIAQEEKQWELGIGIASLYGPDYRSSDQYRSYTAPIPYVVYHGKFIHSDREGVRSNFFTSENIEFILSAGAYISPNADENEARENMPHLGSTMELGPSINIRLSSDSMQNGWRLQLPWRAIFSVAADRNGYVGSIFQPQLVYHKYFTDWTLRYRTGLLFGSDTYHDYYYSVAQQFVTDNRTYYDAHGGYSGLTNEVSLSRPIKINEMHTRLAFLIRYDDLHGVNYDNSPLFKTKSVVRAGFAFIWVMK